MLVVSAAVLFSTATWFSGTAFTPALAAAWNLSETQIAWLTISVQIGFVVGTFFYAVLNLSDVFNARKVFCVSALLAAAFNGAFGWIAEGLAPALVFRFLTGVTLAGVYPVGMKIIASWFRSGLGWRLGIMVGALTVGTASPYLARALGSQFDWRTLVGVASFSSALGGLLVVTCLSDGPFLKKRARFDASMLFKVFRNRRFRYQAMGYFGHMWELYAFWSMHTLYLTASLGWEAGDRRLAWIAFVIIGMGGLGCAAGGWVSQRTGERPVALFSLAVSGLLCAASPLLFSFSPSILLPLMLVWGFFVVADSPQFSALAARYCPPEYTGTALTVQNGVGFAITVISIQLLPMVAQGVGWQWAMAFLLPGPVLGFWYLARLPSVTDDD